MFNLLYSQPVVTTISLPSLYTLRNKVNYKCNLNILFHYNDSKVQNMSFCIYFYNNAQKNMIPSHFYFVTWHHVFLAGAFAQSWMFYWL